MTIMLYIIGGIVGALVEGLMLAEIISLIVDAVNEKKRRK